MVTTERTHPDRATRKQWFAVIGALLGAFMAILDISITNASLQDIQGGLSATLDEGAWISTAYLVAEIIVIPMTGWLSQVFSIRKYLLVNTIFFILASMLCGIAWSLPSMIVFRIIQGFSGGILIPIAVSVILTQLPKAQHPLGLSLFSLAATFAPCIGPTIGGWLTVNYSWPFIFYINLVPGLILFYLISVGLDPQPMKLGLLKKGDWFGIATMATALGSFTVVLEEGTRKDWFSSNLIQTLAWISGISFIIFLIVELKNSSPFINIRLLARRNFLFVNLSMLVFGFGIYGSIFIVPLFLAQIAHLDALQIGVVIMWGGLPQLLIIPFIPKLVKKFDNRILAAFGLFVFGLSALMNSNLTKDWAFDQFFWSQIVRAMGQPFIITALSSLAYTDMEPSEIGSASGLFNMMRNLGGSVGIGLLGTILNSRYHLHFTRLAEATSKYSDSVQNQLASRTQVIASHTLNGGTKQALGSIFGIMNREAFVMAYSDCFLVIGLTFFAGVLLVGLIQKPKPNGIVVVDH